MDFSKYKLDSNLLKDGRLIADKVAVPLWNRLEISPRSADISVALKASVRDPLWLLTRQWQMGEFVGDDAGSIVFAELQMNCTKISSNDNVPLEAVVEQQSIFENNSGFSGNLSIRMQMGNYWFRLLRSEGLSALIPDFLKKTKFAFSLSADAKDVIDAAQYELMLKGRCIDGYKFYIDTKRFDGFPQSQLGKLDKLFKKFEQWYLRVYMQPKKNESKWLPQKLEYGFNVEVKPKNSNDSKFTSLDLGAEEYYHGRLDWYNFDILSTQQVTAAAVPEVKTTAFSFPSGGRNLIPGPVSFDGMPEPRYWTIEDGATNISAISAGKLDISKMALIEFGLVYSNDWSLIPLKVPAGSLVRIDKLEVVDSFGKKTEIPQAGTSQSSGWDSWHFFRINNHDSDTGMNGVFIPPVLVKEQTGKPLEEVFFIRDEVANLIWAIETFVQSPAGKPISGRENGFQPSVPEKGTTLSYLDQTKLPKNWIPFVFVADPADPTKVYLRRGHMMDSNGKAIRPLTTLLRNGLKEDDTQSQSYDIDESEIGREGIRLTKSFQRTRWTNGEIYTWQGNQKTIGKGEGRSALEFDKLVNAKTV